MSAGTKPQRAHDDLVGYQSAGHWSPGYHKPDPLLEMSRVEMAGFSLILGLWLTLLLLGVAYLIGSADFEHGLWLFLGAVALIVSSCIFLSRSLMRKHEDKWLSERQDLLSS